MSIFNKNINIGIMMKLIMVAGILCNCQEKRTVFNQNSECKFEGNAFIVGDSLCIDELVCFFTEKACPTCILDVKKYSESIVNCPKVFFCTNKIGTLNGNFYSIVNAKVISLPDCWTSIKYPLLFQTDQYGKIYDVMEIKYSEPYLIKNYLLKQTENKVYGKDH